MLVPDIEVGRLSLVNVLELRDDEVSFHGVALFYLTNIATACVPVWLELSSIHKRLYYRCSYTQTAGATP